MASSVDFTNGRTYKTCAAGIAFQTAKGSAASSPDIYLKEADVTVNPNFTFFDPQGTHGSRFMAKQGYQKQYQEPEVTLACWVSPSVAAHVFENVTGGEPTSTGSDITITGASNLSTLSLTGIRPHIHCEDLTDVDLTLNFASNGSNYNILVYKEAAKSNLLASATNIPVSTLTNLTAVNNSNLDGTITLAGSVTTGDQQVQIVKTSYVWADDVHAAGYITFFWDTGDEKYTVGDCWIQSLRMTSGGREGVRLEVVLKGMSFAEASSSLTASITDNNFVISRDLTFTYDSAGSNYNVPTEGGFEILIEYDITGGPDNASTVEYFRRENVRMSNVITLHPSDESNTIMDNARAGTYKSLRAYATSSSKGFDIVMDDVVAEPNVTVQASGRAISSESINFMARADLTDGTPSVTSTFKVSWRA